MKVLKSFVLLFFLSCLGGILAQNNDLPTPTQLFDAIKKWDKAKFEQLIGQQKDLVNVQNEYGSTVLMLVIRRPYSLKYQKEKEIVKLLLDKGADPTIKNNKGQTALDQAKRSNRPDSPEIVSMLKEAISSQLIKAVQRGNKKRVEFLMKQGANINVADQYGTNLLMFAIMGNHENILNLLLQQKGIQINKQSKDGTTPLILAAKRGNKDMVQLLLKKGADPTIKDNKGRTALDYAKKDEIAQLLIKNGADVNATDKNGWTSLMVAAKTGHKKIAQLLIANGAKIDAVNKDGITALMIAADHNQKELVQLFFDKGADLTIESKKGKTALDYAQDENNTEIVSLLEKALQKEE